MSRGILRNVDRGQTRKAGPRDLAMMKSGSLFVSYASAVFVKDDFSDGEGSWTDETHLAAQDVDELRQFVQAGRSEDASYARDAMIVHLRLFQTVFFIGVRNHRPEF